MSHTDLTRLIRIQECDSEIAALEEGIGRIPEKISTLDRQLEESHSRLAQVRDRIELKRRELRGLEGEVDLSKGKLSRLKGQLLEVKTNREYQAMLSEIAAAEKAVSERETGILERLLELDELEEELKAVEAAHQDREKDVSARRKELEAFAEEARRDIGSLREKRKELEVEIPSGLMEQYRRIAVARNGRAMAELKDDSCQACHVRLRPQLCAEVRSGRRIALCESCHRILFTHTAPAAAAKSSS